MRRSGVVIGTCVMSVMAVVAVMSGVLQAGQDDRRLVRQPAGGERRVALVVGNDSYPQAGLRNARNDARAMAKALQDLGFTVTLVEDTAREALIEALGSFADQLQKGDVAFFYYAGHGVELDQQNYLVPVDFKMGSATAAKFNLVNVSAVQEALQPARVSMLVLDACRNNPFTGTRGSNGLAAMTARGGLIAFATGAGQTASDNAAEANGLFTAELLKMLREPGLMVQEVFRQVRENVYSASLGRQRPALYEDVVGQLVLRPAATLPPAASALTAPAPPPAGAGRPVTAGATRGEYVVSPSGGDYTTIGEAIANARPGDRILVRPGRYQEGLLLDKPLEIIGDGRAEDIIVESPRDGLLFDTTAGRVANLTLRHVGGGEWFGVKIAQGRLKLEACDITSDGLSSVMIRGGADPSLRNNRIHDAKQNGVLVLDGAQGTLEDNDIYGNTYAGVEIRTGGNPTLRRNRIRDGKQSGLNVHDNGLGVLEDNDIYGNAYSGVSIRSGGNPTLRRNRITRNTQYAASIRDLGAGLFEENDLRENQRGAWSIASDSESLVKRVGNLAPAASAPAAPAAVAAAPTGTPPGAKVPGERPKNAVQATWPVVYHITTDGDCMTIDVVEKDPAKWNQCFCRGALYVTDVAIGFKGDVVAASNWEVPLSRVSEAKKNSLVWKNFGAFHIKLASGDNYNFIPANGQGQLQAPEPILSAILQAVSQLRKQP